MSMLFQNEISNIRYQAAAIERCLTPLERVQLDMADVRRLDLRQSAKALREAADRCDAVADRFDAPTVILLEAAE